MKQRFAFIRAGGASESSEEENYESDYGSSSSGDEGKTKRGILSRTPCARDKPFPYQKGLAKLVNPATPMNRMLVAWRTGSGKTDGMIKVLRRIATTLVPKF